MPGEANPACTTSYALQAGSNEIKIPLDSVNDSLQVGDLIFVLTSSSNQVINNIDLSYTSPTKIGTVIDLDSTSSSPSITINFINSATGPCAPESGDYLMFAKDKTVNTSGLKGYYLEATFNNNSTNYAELFSVGTEPTESSK